jgi:CRISPR-associated endonuclease Csn1
MKILGLDLGTNSIGWAVVDNSLNQILDAGVRIFPAGIEPDTIGQGESEKSRNATRREKRQIRRQYFRKRLRKIKLLELLIMQGMCPLTLEDLKHWEKWDKNKKNEGRQFPDSLEFLNWIRMNPYYLRERALQEQISLEELGRIFYHFIHRRGFISSRKSKEDSTIFTKGKPEENILSINETKERIKGSTLGSYLHSISSKEKEPYKISTDDSGKEIRVRGRYTLREMYIAEFEKIWFKQAEYYNLDEIIIESKKSRNFYGPLTNSKNQQKLKYLLQKFGAENIKILDGEKFNEKKVITSSKIKLKEKLGGYITSTIDEEGELIVEHKSKESILFWQRPLRTQKQLVASCRFENQLPVITSKGNYLLDNKGELVRRSKKPCHLSHPDFELFRAYQFINNIKYGKNVKLTEFQRQKVLDLINNQDSGFDFKKIPQELNLTYEKFNYEDDFKVVGNYTNRKLKGLFSDEVWNSKYDEIWHCFYFFEDSDKLYIKLTQDYGYSGDQEKIAKIRLKEGYSNVSLKAIRNILPFLIKGYQYDRAVILGGVRNAFGKRWDYFKEDHDQIERKIVDILKEDNKEGEAIGKIKDMLSAPIIGFGFAKEDLRFAHLYHHSQEIEKSDDLLFELSEIENLRNPIVQQALNETRRLVNLLLEKYRKKYGPEFHFDRINVEMGRELRNSKTERQEMSTKIRDNESKNDEARQRLAEFGLKPFRDNVHKYLLFKEIESRANGPVICPYTGKIVNIKNLLGSENAIQIEHIIPYSISLDDSFVNKTICESKFNGLKGEKTPYQFYCENPDSDLWGIARGTDKEDGWNAITERAFRILPYPKAKRFSSKKAFESSDFIDRQLNDTRYIARKAKEILSAISHDVRVMPGQLTAELRHLWGLNNVLQSVKTIDVIDIEVNENESVPIFLITDEFGNTVSAKRKLNKKPETYTDELLISGVIKDQKFGSKQVKLTLDAADVQDGWYWAKLKITDTLKILPMYVDKPIVDEDHIVFRGLVAKGNFNNDTLGKRKVTIEDGRYWARVTINDLKFEEPVKGKEPAVSRNQILLYGNVDSGIFSSFIYKCEANLPDGKYWLILNYNSDEIEYTKAEYSRPETIQNEFVITATVDLQGNLVADIDPGYQKLTDNKPGRYYTILNIDSVPVKYFPIENKPDALEKGQKLVEGSIWVDTHTGEIKFDPKKNRDDHRHHAVDAITIALTEQRYLQNLSTVNANRKNKLRNHPYSTEGFPEPWIGFDKDVRRIVESILVSHKKSNKVLTKNKKGFSVRGQLHKENVFGKRQAPMQTIGYHRRTKITDMKDYKDIQKVVDVTIQKIIKDHLAENCNVNVNNPKGFEIPKDAFIKDGNWRVFLPNKNGDPVPIKKVRIKENLGKAVQLKSDLNQWVNPRNNHHVLIYKDFEGNLKEDVVQFWTMAERILQGIDIYQLPENGKEIVEVLEINDLFILGLTNEEYDINKSNYDFLSKYLYKVEAISSKYYEFRHHLESSQKNSNEPYYFIISSLGTGKKGWYTFNPIKIKLDFLGKIYI